MADAQADLASQRCEKDAWAPRLAPSSTLRSLHERRRVPAHLPLANKNGAIRTSTQSFQDLIRWCGIDFIPKVEYIWNVRPVCVALTPLANGRAHEGGGALFARSGRTYEAATLGDDVLYAGPMRIGIFIAC